MTQSTPDKENEKLWVPPEYQEEREKQEKEERERKEKGKNEGCLGGCGCAILVMFAGGSIIALIEDNMCSDFVLSDFGGLDISPNDPCQWFIGIVAIITILLAALIIYGVYKGTQMQ